MEPQSTNLPDISLTKHVQVSSRSTTRASVSGSQLERSEDNDYLEGVEDEDYELQAALQASLTSREGYGSSYNDMAGSSADPSSQTYSNVASRSALSDANSRPFSLYHGHDSVDPDPVAASTERNRVLLRRVREQQELAQRELWSTNGLDPEQQEVQRQVRLRQEEEEAEQLRKAIAESEDMARQWDERQKSSSRPAKIPGFPSASRNDDTSMPVAEDTLSDYRQYNDEDAELQAALRASLENVPSGRHQQPLQSKLPMAQRTPVTSSQRTPKDMNVDEDEIEIRHSELSDSSGNMGSSTVEPSTHLSLDEIRQARLARFGS